MFTLLGWVAAIAATAFVVRYWDDIISVASDFVRQVASHWDMYVQDVLNGAWESVIQRLSEDVAICAQQYYFRGSNGKYYRESVCEEISVDEIPPHLRNKVKTQNVTDATNTMRQEMIQELY